MYRSFFILCSNFVAGFAVAAEVAVIDPVSPMQLARVSGGLLLVVVAIVASAALLKRLKAFQGGSGGHLKIIDGLALSSRERVVLMEVDNERILIGVTSGNIRALHVLPSAASKNASFSQSLERATAATESIEALK